MQQNEWRAQWRGNGKNSAKVDGLPVLRAGREGVRRGNPPVDLLYVADLSKTVQAGSQAEFFTAADVGFIGENVYLYLLD
jgi:hypothetical protein